MKPAAQWFRVPTWANPFDANPVQAGNARAVVYLLMEWHLGADPTERQLRALTGFGAGRSTKLFWETLAWAKESGAAYPERLLNVSGPKLDHKRTTTGPQADHSDVRQTPRIAEERTNIGPQADHERTTSRARVPIESRESSEGDTERAAAPVPDAPRNTPAAGAPAHGAHPSLVPASPPAESHPPAAVKSANVVTPALPPTEDAPLTVNGIELPRDLPALLSGIHPGFMHFIRMLLPAGVENTERLLRLSREEWRFMGHGLNPAKVNAIEAHLSATWGVSLGALAKVETKGAPSKKPTLFPPRADRAPSVDAIDHMFRKKGDPPKEVSRAE